MVEPRNPRFAQAVRDSFASQRLMATIGARLAGVASGEIEIRVPFRSDLTQQHGFLHAGVVTAALDSACGYAAFSLMPEGAGVLTVEFKTNLLAPARGEELIARGRVVRAGRTISASYSSPNRSSASSPRIRSADSARHAAARPDLEKRS